MTWHTCITIISMSAVLFVTALLRGAQSKAASGGHKRMAFCGGSAMSACELIVMITMAGVAQTLPNPYYALFSSFGAGCGWVAGMMLHDRLMRKRHEKLKLAKKGRRVKQIDRVAREAMEDFLIEKGLL